MQNCPQCRNVIVIEAHFCDRCGYRLAYASSPPALLHTTNTTQTHSIVHVPTPTRTIRPLVTHQRQVPPAVQALPAHAPLTLPMEDLSTDHIPIVVVKGKPQLLDTHERLDQMKGDESFVATSIAAEHWRTSWRNRQRTEAGPATTVSRGHSSVPEPLLAMQQSLLRMRAIIPHQTKQLTGPGFWITIILILCIIGGLVAYIISTYLPVAGKPVHVNTHIAAQQPTLIIQESPLATFAQGQMLRLYEENFHTGVRQ